MVLTRIIEQSDIARSDVHSHVHLTRLECHSACIRIVNGGDFHRFIRHFAIPVVGVLLHDGLFLNEGFADIGSRANRSLLGKIAILFRRNIDDEEERICQIARHTRSRLVRRDDEILSFRLHLRVLEERRGARVLGKGALDGGLDSLCRQRVPVRELHAVADLERPRELVVADRPFLCEPRLDVHLLIKLRQRLAHTVAHDDPAESIFRRLKRVREVRHADAQGILRSLFAAAACEYRHGQTRRHSHRKQFLPLFH